MDERQPFMVAVFILYLFSPPNYCTMNKLICLIVVIVFSVTNLKAQKLLSPKDFLGYELGTQYTYHHKIVEYIKHVAANAADKVSLQPYGKTNEGRELYLLYISSPQNLQQLEQIRKANLTTTGLLKDNNTTLQEMPAIVWLSYNVHGNEPSSSEAALATIYALLTHKEAQDWLKNTLVIVDPCLNPDGRDRYVNWYNQVKNSIPDANIQSREHQEPWPGGRSNHYNFDLNRDWAWQTQIETQQRLKVYNQWMPHIHVDFHEQGVNEPYYFAPAAEPLHEVVTPWQKDFQTVIGRNHAKYFDKNGWLYFTKERFDVFYPAYGDSYPMFNGSIGMTYEQAGHSRGGLAVVTNEEDTLTLVDRVAHHYTTGMSTIEIASKNKNQLLQEFAKYFKESNEAKNAVYKTFILTSDNWYKIEALKKLLISNQIQFGTINNANGLPAFNYQTLKDDKVKLAAYHIAVPVNQPKSNLATVLLEPKSKLNDSATYDITAWSLPYVYGVEAYALKEVKAVMNAVAPLAKVNNVQTNYGYIIPYNSMASVKALLYLHKAGVKVRYAEKPFVYKGKNFAAGSLIVIKKMNDLTVMNNAMNYLANTYNLSVETVETGFMDKGVDFGSPDVKLLTAPKVMMLTGEGVASGSAGEIWYFFEKELNYPLTLVNANDLSRVNLSGYHILIMPDGYYRNMKENIDKLKEFMKQGGRVIALENAASQLTANPDHFGVKLKGGSDEKAADNANAEYSLLKQYANREKDFLPESISGAIYKVDLDTTHPLAFGYNGSTYYTLKQNAQLYEFLKDGWNVGYLKKENYVSGFGGFRVKNKLKDGVVLGTTEVGNGALVFFADDPLFRMFWENGKLLFSNAVFLYAK